MYRKIRKAIKEKLKQWNSLSEKNANRPRTSTAPFFKLIIPVIVGILLQTELHFPLVFFCTIFATSIPFLFLITFSKINTRLPLLGNLYPLFLALCFCGLSGLYTHFYDDRRLPTYFSQYASQENLLEVSIAEMPVESENSVKSVVEVLKVKDSLGWHKTSGNILFYFEKNDHATCLNYGDKLLIQTSLREINPPQNPHEFNYKKYLANKHIYYHSYIHKNEWIAIEKDKTTGIYSLAFALRKNFLDKLKKSGLTANESAISSGILLGWTYEIDPTTFHEFTSAGITHLLCVSGLHVGIISLLAGYMFFFLNKTRKHRKIKGLIQIFVLFLFAFITGLSPSVMRAAFMFSFIIFGQMFSRSPNVYNSLGVSALILLLIDPLFLMQVGFQLSFIAVLGIVSIQPILFNWVKTKYILPNLILELAMVSLSVQIITLPFVLYYFHQFPIYFLIANIIIIPFMGILLANILLVVFLGWIPWLGGLLALILSIGIKGIILLVQWVESLPYSLLTNIPFSFSLACILAAAILFGTLIYLEKKRQYVFVFLALFILFLSMNLIEIKEAKNQQNTTFYSLNKKTFAAEFTIGNKSYIVGNTPFIQNPTKSEFQITNNHTQTRQKNIEYISVEDSNVYTDFDFFKKGHIVQFRTAKYFFFTYKNSYEKTKCPIELDYLVLFENPKISVPELQNLFSFKTLIISNANSDRKIAEWEADCKKYNQPYFSVQKQGAFQEK